jgi:hypothetical protein
MLAPAQPLYSKQILQNSHQEDRAGKPQVDSGEWVNGEILLVNWKIREIVEIVEVVEIVKIVNSAHSP